ncbi:MAG: alpha/beta fold hydrolase [Candidatus Fimenecus sp.]
MDIKLHYIEKGVGEPLVLLHGNGSSLNYFQNQIETFSKFYRVFAVDTRGHGQSPRGTAPFTIRQFSEDLRDFLDEHDLKKVYLLGFSDGGNIALTFALRYPEYIEKLIVNGANLDTKGVKPQYQIPIEIGYRLTKLFANRSEAAHRKCELLGLMVNEPNIRLEQLRTLTMPTLVLVGTNDMIKDAHSRAIAAALPNAEFVVLQGGHGIAKDVPEEYNRAVLDFLEKQM